MLKELPRLWGSMAVLRSWLSQLNRPGLKSDPEKAWLPVTQHNEVVKVDDRIDKALEHLGELSKTMRASFSVLHVQLSEKQRERQEDVQHRIELIAAIFLVPTLIVGFYGANTWVPGQGKHWGFWIMVAILLAGTAVIFSLILRWQQAQKEANRKAAEERARLHAELLRSL
jgi:Mg2+ and Co2+ transporter CorA